jgi:hypothetical protein
VTPLEVLGRSPDGLRLNGRILTAWNAILRNLSESADNRITSSIIGLYAAKIDIDSLRKLAIIWPAGKFGNPGNNGEDYRMQKGRDVKDLRIRRAKG